jgi:hypothetical protein
MIKFCKLYFPGKEETSWTESRSVAKENRNVYAFQTHVGIQYLTCTTLVQGGEFRFDICYRCH